MNVKIFLTDLDGTFLDSSGNVPGENYSAISELKRAGIITVVATGRTPVSAGEIVKQIQPDYFIGLNGAIIIRMRDKRVISRHSLKKDITHKLVSLLNESEIFNLVCSFDGIYCVSKDLLFKTGVRRDILERKAGGITEIQSVYDIEPATLFVVTKDSEQESKLKDIVSQISEVKIMSALNNGYDIIPTGIDKSSGMAELCNLLNIPLNAAVAVGDSENDIPMLKTAGKGIALANAMPGAKTAADHIAPGNDENGVAQVINRILEGIRKGEKISWEF